jgi:hypothetical protein
VPKLDFTFFIRGEYHISGPLLRRIEQLMYDGEVDVHFRARLPILAKDVDKVVAALLSHVDLTHVVRVVMRANGERAAGREFLIPLLSDIEDFSLQGYCDGLEVGRNLEVKDTVTIVLEFDVLKVLGDRD